MIGFSVNMVTVEEKGKVKVLTSAKAKQDGSVDPARQVTFEQIHKGEPRFLKSQIEVGESSKPRVTSRILLNKWQRQQEKERYQKRKYEDRSENMKKIFAGRNKKNICESKSVHIGDVPCSDTVGMRV
jgi:phosphopantetheine adenylyltransferase